MIRFLFILFIGMALVGCTSGEQEEKTSAEHPQTTDSTGITGTPESNPSSEKERIMFQFICRDIGQGMDNPYYEVSLRVGSNYYTLDTIHTCETITLAHFDEYEIPEQAVAACGGWYHAEGEYYYAIEDGDRIKVMYAWQTEEQSVQGYFYKEKREIPLPEVEDLYP